MTLTLSRRHFLYTASAAAAASFVPRSAFAATPLTMQAAWINDAEFAGYFLAMDKGYYAAEDLDLTYLSGGPDVIPESTIIAGRADLAGSFILLMGVLTLIGMLVSDLLLALLDPRIRFT